MSTIIVGILFFILWWQFPPLPTNPLSTITKEFSKINRYHWEHYIARYIDYNWAHIFNKPSRSKMCLTNLSWKSLSMMLHSTVFNLPIQFYFKLFSKNLLPNTNWQWSRFMTKWKFFYGLSSSSCGWLRADCIKSCANIFDTVEDFMSSLIWELSELTSFKIDGVE